MNASLRIATVFVVLLALSPLAPAQNGIKAPFGKVIGYRVDNSYLTGDGGRYLAFSEDKRALISVGGAVFDTSTGKAQLGPVFRNRSQDAFRLVFQNDGRRLFALGKELSLWEISVDAPASGSVLPFAYWDANPATNPSFKSVKLPDALAKLDGRKALTVTPDAEHIIVCIQEKIEKRSLKTGKVVANAQVGGNVRRLYPLGKDGPFLLWSSDGQKETWDGDAIAVDAFTEPPSPVKGRSRSSHGFPLAVSPNCKTAFELVDLGNDGNHWIYVWDLAQRKVIETMPGFKDASAITCLGDGSGYAVGYRTGRIEIRNLSHKVIEVVSPGEAIHANYNAQNLIAEMASGGPDGSKLAAYYPRGELVLYERAQKLPDQPKPTVNNFPARIGSKWVYTHTVEGRENGEMAFEIGGVEVVGTDRCVRFDRNHLSGNNIHFRESLLLAYREDGLYWVGSVSRSSSDSRFFSPPVMMLPKDRSKTDLQFSSKFPFNTIEFKLRLREATIDVPYGTKLETTRLDRNLSNDVTSSESIWFAKDIGIVKWQDATTKTILELKSYTPR